MENPSKTRIIGIDAGTNSLGWAIVDKDRNGQYELIDRGVNIFQEGVKIEKGIESSRAAERTEYRSSRKHYWRRKIRKIELLRLLSEYDLCPPLSNQELKAWRKEDLYPLGNEDFMKWQGTDEAIDYQPYALRHECVTSALNMQSRTDRWKVGRSLYHIAQRRGFLSNRKEQADADNGKVKEGIGDLNKQMEDAGCKYLCDYFYMLYQKGERIRAQYTDRVEHYEKEFERICDLQHIEGDKKTKLHRAIFFQRPLKSQKQSVGKCPFEPGKTRCALSHPAYEKFRMWSFIRNIKIKTPADAELRALTQEETAKITRLWSRRSKHSFPFEDIAKALAPKKQYGYYKDDTPKPYLFNYHLDTNVSSCEVVAQLEHAFGAEAEYLLGNPQIEDLAWNALFFFDDADKLKDFAKRQFGLDEEHAEIFSNIHLPQGYASLSLKAIRLITPLMAQMGLIYSHAVFLAKVEDLLHKNQINEDEVRDELLPILQSTLLRERDENGLIIAREERERSWHQALTGAYGLNEKQLSRLYHPSMIETYPKVQKGAGMPYQLGSPRISSVKNPMAMHSLFRMRKVLNELLKEGKINEKTIVHIEFARELNDANRRKAIQSYQRDLEKKRQEAEKAIQDVGIAHPSEADILKYILWEEQEHKCVYTGNTIGIHELFDGKKYDIEHTIPRSMGGCSTRANMTICESKFNREIKRDQLPSELANHQIILERIAGWKEKIESLDKLIRKINTRGMATKDAKDKAIIKRHNLELQRDYWREKYQSFVIEQKDVEGFSRRQGTDISVINRYAKMYLQSVFERVDVVKGVMTAAFRKEWGLQDFNEKKSRDNHAHHCVDAVTIACMGRYEYELLSHFYHMDALNRRGEAAKPHFEKPWASFTEDMKALHEELLIAHHTPNNMHKHTRKKLRDRNGVVPGVIMQGDTARGALHLDTTYGAIKVNDDIRYVVRKRLDETFAASDIKNIVDPAVRTKVESIVSEYGSIKDALAAEGTIWLNREKGVAIRHVRVFTPSVTRPNHIRQQRDLSKHEHKQQYHVMSDSNYCMAIYEGQDTKGKVKREFRLVNNLSASAFFKRSQQTQIGLVPQISEKGYVIKVVLKKGDMVLLYENSPEEIWMSSDKELVRRLYKVTGLNSFSSGEAFYGRIEFTHHQESRSSSEIKAMNGAYVANEAYRAKIIMLHTQIQCLVEGHDFKLTETGRIIRL